MFSCSAFSCSLAALATRQAGSKRGLKTGKVHLNPLGCYLLTPCDYSGAVHLAASENVISFQIGKGQQLIESFSLAADDFPHMMRSGEKILAAGACIDLFLHRQILLSLSTLYHKAELIFHGSESDPTKRPR